MVCSLFSLFCVFVLLVLCDFLFCFVEYIVVKMWLLDCCHVRSAIMNKVFVPSSDLNLLH